MSSLFRSSFLIILLSLFTVTTLMAEKLKARLEWAHTVDLRVLESGIVETVAVLEGQRITKGSELLSLDQRDFDLAVTSAESSLVQAEVVLDHAKRKHEWNVELYDQGMVSDNEHHDTLIDLRNAEAKLAAAKADLERKKLARERSRLLAPMDAVVVLVDAWPGQVILPSLQREPLIRLASSRQMVARARVSADRVGLYQTGQQAEVMVGKQKRTGKLYRIGAVSEGVLERGVAYAVDVIFDVADDEHLRPGQFCHILF